MIGLHRCVVIFVANWIGDPRNRIFQRDEIPVLGLSASRGHTVALYVTGEGASGVELNDRRGDRKGAALCAAGVAAPVAGVAVGAE